MVEDIPIVVFAKLKLDATVEKSRGVELDEFNTNKSASSE
jgi:hypothetical protein